ncbi:hypothetical protein SAMN05444851_2502 [Aliiroseovarius sediminilitoris]|uniref:Peptidase propeptide and YPEB domain-containing protein n=1 Tax=Aliiroseovarius sediminilitoris TaxID=1173584 RepID=A0A1I0QF24_9RHOB|nr:hypothetical protein [Aliiroseovarius sediminilitoris]SEW25704.1 hypothetical protein SAMN05444851_2502 [Aliiroseovarius sediminilitoris]
MKRNKIALTATSGLVGLSVFAGSMAFASSDSTAKSAEELQQFLTANPEVAAVVAGVETNTGGKVVGAEFDDEATGNGIVEFEVMMADGTEQDMLYTLADGSMTVEADEDGDDGDDGDDDDNEADEDGENEADDDK